MSDDQNHPGEALGVPDMTSRGSELSEQPVSELEDGSVVDTEEEHEREWWDDPAMPWKSKPGRSDIACLSWMGVLGIFSLVMMPVRAWLMGSTSRIPLLVALTGSRSGTGSLGALLQTGDYSVVWHLGGLTINVWWILPVLAGTIMSCKFDWVYWWAGRLWGRGIIEVWAGKSDRARRRYQRMERWAHKAGWLGMVIAYLPIPLPIMPVVFVLAGASRMPLKKFIAMDLVVCLGWLLAFVGLGWIVGEPIKSVLDVYARVANYVAIALVIGIVAWSFINSAKKAKA